jgi:hypothetical protein
MKVTRALQSVQNVNWSTQLYLRVPGAAAALSQPSLSVSSQHKTTSLKVIAVTDASQLHRRRPALIS